MSVLSLRQLLVGLADEFASPHSVARAFDPIGLPFSVPAQVSIAACIYATDDR